MKTRHTVHNQVRVVSLGVGVGVAALAVVATLFHAPDWVGLPLGLCLTLLLPGWALLSAVVPGLAMDSPERATAILATSISCDICVGLLLGPTRIGLTASSVAVVLAAVVAVAAAVGMRRLALAKELPGNSWLRVAPRLRSGLLVNRGRLAVAITTSLAALILVVVVVMGSVRSAVSQAGPPFTSLSVAVVGRSYAKVTLTSHSASTGLFRIQVSEAGTSLGTWSNVPLEPGHTWAKTVKIQRQRSRGKVTVSLYMSGSERLYGSATLVVP